MSPREGTLSSSQQPYSTCPLAWHPYCPCCRCDDIAWDFVLIVYGFALVVQIRMTGTGRICRSFPDSPTNPSNPAVQAGNP